MGQPTPTSVVSTSKTTPMEVSLDKGKGILGSVPLDSLKEEQLIRSPLREFRQSESLQKGFFGDITSNLYRLDCPRFDGIDF